jgi:hypothetical protein
MSIYQLIRHPRWLYRIICQLSYQNHEKKIILQRIIFFLEKTDKLILLIPLLFWVEGLLADFAKNLGGQTSTLSSSDNFLIKLSELVTQFVKLPIIGNFHTIFLNQTFFSWFIAVFLFYVSRVLRNSYGVYRNEAEVSECFHAVNHDYRDFIDSVIALKKNHQIFKPTLMNGHSHALGPIYNAQIRELCRRAQHSMATLLNDNNCYISIKWLEDDGDGNYKLRHDRSYPEYKPTEHVTDIDLINASVENPKTLFQKIINKFKNSNLETLQTWNMGEISNDVKGDGNFDASLIKNNFSKIKATIVIPITVESSLKGFFCFNSTKIGKLREKHRHFLCGYCDLIANIFRSVATDLGVIAK